MKTSSPFGEAAAGPGPDRFLPTSLGARGGRWDFPGQGTRRRFHPSPETSLCPLSPPRAGVRSRHPGPQLGSGQRQLHRHPQLHGGQRGQRVLQLDRPGGQLLVALRPQRQPPAPLLPPQRHQPGLRLHRQQPRQQQHRHLQLLRLQLRAVG